MLLCNDRTLPIKNAAEFHNICVPKLNQFFGGLLTASATATVHHNKSVLVGQFGNLVCTDIFVGNINGIRNMPQSELIGTADIKNDVVTLFLFYLFGKRMGQSILLPILRHRRAPSAIQLTAELIQIDFLVVAAVFPKGFIFGNKTGIRINAISSIPLLALAACKYSPFGRPCDTATFG